MDLQLRLFLVAIVIVLFIIIINMLRKDRLELKYTLLWLGAILIMSLVIIFPEIVFSISSEVGIINPVNLVFFIQGIFVITILLSITAIVSGLNKRIRKQAQEIALIEERVRKLEKNSKTEELNEK